MRSPYQGRDADLDALERACMPGKVVLLHGPPGVGKSRLCLEFATRIKTQHRVVHLDCSGVRSLEVLYDELARTLHVTLLPDHDAAQLGGSLLARRIHLLVLDGVDLLGEGLATWLQALITHHPELCILATAQAARDDFAHKLAVAPLKSDAHDAPGVLLLSALLSQARLELLSVEQLIDIATRLDGLPLCIELCAPHLEVMRAEVLLAQLDAQLLVGHNATPNALFISIELAWQQLDEDARHVLMAASLCQATFDLDALGAITRRDPGQLTGPLLTLRRHALIHDAPHAPLRYMVLGSVRDFVRRHHTDADIYTTHHTAWRTHLETSGATHAYEAHFHDSLESHAWLERHHDDVINALREESEEACPGMLGAVLYTTLSSGGSPRVEGWRGALERVLEAPPEGTERACALSALLFTTLRWTYAEVPDVLEGLRAAHLALLAHHGQTPGTLTLHAELLYRTHVMHEDDALIEHMTWVVDTLRTLDDPLATWAEYHLILMHMLYRGDAVIDELMAMSVRFEQLDMPRLATSAVAQCAIAALHVRKSSLAIEHLNRTIELAASADFASLHARALSLRAMVSGGRLPPSQRTRDMNAALALMCERGDYTGEAHIRAQLTSMHAEQREYQDAYRHGTRALMIYRALHHSYMPRQIELVLMQCAWLMGDATEFAQRLVRFQPGETPDDIDPTMERTEILWAINLLGPVKPSSAQGAAQIDQALEHDTLSAWWRALFTLMRAHLPAPRTPGLAEACALGACLGTHDMELEERLLMRMFWEKLPSESRRALLDAASPEHQTLYIRRARDARLTAVALASSPDEELVWTELARRPVMSAMLHAMLAHHAHAPGEAMPSLTLAEQIWPDDMMTPDALSNRLYNVMAQLKKMGFGHLIESNREGYWLSISLIVRDIDQLAAPC